MTAVQLLLKHQFPKIRSLEDTLRQQIAPLKSIPPGSLQILLVNSNHWITVSTIKADGTDITVYDSKYSHLHCDTKRLLSQLVHTCKKSFTVRMANVNKQAGDNDCGLFAAAYCTSLAHGCNPSACVYEQASMRSHLLKCLEEKKMIPFPTIRQRRVGTAKVMDVEVYCYCRCVNDGSPMVQCDGKSYKEWFHIDCVSDYVNGEIWLCKDCLTTS